MSKKGLPLILAGGAALLLMGGSKGKKKKSTKQDSEGDIPYAPEWEDDTSPYTPPSPSPSPSPKPKPTSPTQPSGNPPRGSDYDEGYWGSNTDERLISIRQHFVDLGYPVDVSPHPMNTLGPKGSVEMENVSGSMGKLGGGDDDPSNIVQKFQHDYNTVSRLNKAEKIYPSSMGGLDGDGMVGPYTLNALRYSVENLPGGKTWNDLLLMAKNKGI